MHPVRGPIRDAEELAKTIDHTLLRPDASLRDVERLCRDACQYHLRRRLRVPALGASTPRTCSPGATSRSCAVVSFPYGSDGLRAKIAAAEDAVERGAGEIDVVVNLPALLSGDYVWVRDELARWCAPCASRRVNSGTGMVIVKAIIETCYLTPNSRSLPARSSRPPASTSSRPRPGAGPQGATVADVELLRDTLSERVGVKASGGIRSLRPRCSVFINAGAARIGTSAGADIMREFLAHRAVS